MVEAAEEWAVISVDDHVIEPPHTWTSRVPAKYKDRAPKVVERGDQGIAWDFDGDVRFFSGMMCSVDQLAESERRRIVPRFEDLYDGCSDVGRRLADMDAAGVLASMCFPTMPGFGGTYLNLNTDRDLSYACIRAYNDFMTEEWCAAAPGRLIPAVLVPMWDPALAVKELERVAPRGVRSVVFSERPHHQGFPSLYDKDRYWDPLFAAAQEMDLPLSCHIGSSSRVDCPEDGDYLTHMSEVWLNAPYSMTEYIFSGAFDRFPGLRVVYSEASIGWIPYQLQTMDRYYDDRPDWADSTLEHRPSDYFGRNVFGAFIDDPVGIRFIEDLGADAVMCEVDYPHGDSIWPDVRKAIDAQIAGLPEDVQYKLRIANAKRVYGFEPSGLGRR
ncbi:amidohydrolase family protein [Actinomadura sp. 3N508]|uniref:amidohydrolase family protein n=1 Tax=Actinomadura sp. 3N508 TaxID=3375153 RepID=UPI00378A332B